MILLITVHREETHFHHVSTDYIMLLFIIIYYIHIICDVSMLIFTVV